ncbi:hypothetical protein DB41_JE00020 [Neochlamydia sp. TUME1]|nr:MgtC/SapB family protein [Neochlamydia sp. TUME1]KIC73601.1 hypothetical protein DB41_JE00020 [Neochlamydia sp. TUME1]
MLPALPAEEMILRLLLSGLLGGLIGFERERLSWVAGLRTHMLVCLGSTLIMLVSQYAFHEVVHEGLINLDPSRVAAQVVSGIGFLGAGTILFLKKCDSRSDNSSKLMGRGGSWSSYWRRALLGSS